MSKRTEGWRIRLGPGGAYGHKSFPPDTPQATVEAELVRMRQRSTAGRAHAPASGSLGADVTRYLADYMTGHPGRLERTRHLALWTAALGQDASRQTITRDDIARVLNGWRAAGLAAETCNKRRTALLALYHALDGRGGSNPVREIAKFRAPDPLPRGVPYALIEKALALVPAGKTRARLSVIAYTGIRHGQLMTLTADAWDTKHRLLTVPGTGKGRGTKPYTIPLSPDATAALTALDTADAWGRFTWAPMARLWRQAWYAMTLKVKRTPQLVVPATFVAPTPYDLRHSFGTQVYRATGDLKATKELMGHSSIRMTERYMLAAVPEHKKSAIALAFGSKGRK